MSSGRSSTQRFVAWAMDLHHDDLPAEVVHHARRLLLDSVGISIASSAAEFGRRFRGLPAVMSGGSGATALGLAEKVPAERAALVNGTLAHGLDFDDTYQPGIVHIGAVVIPAVVAVAEEVGATPEEVGVAVVLGYELASRIGEAAPGQFHKYGWHATPLCGVFAAALSASRLYGSTEEETVAALGIAGSFASGIQEFLREGKDTKRLHAGWAASAGVQAAQLARIGFEGAAGILEGHYGLYATHLREGDIVIPERLTEGLGERWNTTALSVKPFPCCHLMHAHIDAARRIAERGIALSDIVAIRAYGHATTLHVLAEPLDEKRRPRSSYGAQFSLPYGVAVGLVDAGRSITLDTFAPERLDDPELVRLMGLTDCVLDEESQLPKYYDGAVEVTLADGSTILEREPINRGSPERPLSDDELLDKFVGNARLAGLPEALARTAGRALLDGGDVVAAFGDLNAATLQAAASPSAG
jgi:2-methylcitrate dehydratase PrpD